MKQIFLRILFFAASILFVSCSNFFQAEEVKNAIKAAREYDKAPSYVIKINSPIGSGVIKSPASGEVTKKVTDAFTVSFGAYDEYEFIEWKIIDSNTRKEYQNGEFLSLDSVSQESTTCTFVKAPEQNMQLSLVALVASRPWVFNKAPLSGDNGAYKNAPIEITFNHEMASESLYYSDEEMGELKYEFGLENSNFLEDGSSNYYGYVKDGQTFYKVISVIDQNTKISLLDNYGPPYLKASDSATLVIPNTKPLTYGTYVLATVKKEVAYKQKKLILQQEDTPWFFFVGNSSL